MIRLLAFWGGRGTWEGEAPAEPKGEKTAGAHTPVRQEPRPTAVNKLASGQLVF